MLLHLGVEIVAAIPGDSCQPHCYIVHEFFQVAAATKS
jgi:hypothetical protein